MKKIIKGCSIFFALGITALILTYLLAYVSGKPEIGKSQSISFYDTDGELFYASVNERNGQWASIDEVSEYFIKAIVDIEDQHFYYHLGFDPIGITRAAWNNLKNGDLSQGASTITQQYVKNLFLTNEKTFQRKIKELWISMQGEMHYSKE